MVERQLGNLDTAEALAREALEIGERIGDEFTKPFAFSGLAAIATERGEFERAATLVGAAEAIMEAQHMAWPPDERPHYERLLADLPEAMGSDEFERARSRGQSMGAERGSIAPSPLGTEPSRRTDRATRSNREPVLYSAHRSPLSRPLPNAPPAASAAHRPRNRRVNVLDEIVQDQLRTDLPELATGDTVKVSAKVVEGNRERIQVFEGTVMRLRGGGITRSITVRRIASGVGVERTFKINSPRIEKIEVVRHGQVRRAQLYFLRKRVGKAATLRERRSERPRRPVDPADRRSSIPAPPARRRPRLAGTLAPDGRHRPDPSLRAPPVERRARPGSSASTRSASRRPAGRSSRRP